MQTAMITSHPVPAKDGKSTAPKPGGKLLTLKGAAELLSVSYWTVRDWADRGILPVVRLPGGRLVRVELAAIEALIARSRS